MTQPTIRPPHAISLWIQDNVLIAELPNTQDQTAQAHYLRFPHNVYGLTQLVEVLRARDENSRIGSKGDPTQAQTDKELALLAKGFDPSKIKRKEVVKMDEGIRGTIRDILRKAGL